MAIPQNKTVSTPSSGTRPPSQGPDTNSQSLCSDVLAITPPLSTPASPFHQPRPAQRKRIVRITRPEPGSIYDIMHDHQGDSLYQHPICWTDAHARLLNAHFVDQAPVRKPVPDFNSVSSSYPPRPSKVATALCNNLTSILSSRPSSFNPTAITQVMSTFFPATLSTSTTDLDLNVHFGARTLKRAVRVSVLWQYGDGLPEAHCVTSFASDTTRPASFNGRIPASVSQVSNRSSINSPPPPARPILAFVNRAHLAMVRRNLYCVQPGPTVGDKNNTPVANLQKARSKRLIPQVTDRDSYLVAIMLAIAQSQCYPPRSSPQRSSPKSSCASQNKTQEALPPPEFKDVPVRILSQDSDEAEFVVYSTTVTATFLKRFAAPMKAPSADALGGSGLKIHVTKVPVWPVLGLKERLARALGPEICGEECSLVANDGIETWECEHERIMRVGNLKRGRDVLSEVFNTSFDLDEGESGRRPSFSVPSPGRSAGLGNTASSPSASPRTPKRRRTEALNGLEVC